DARPVRGRDRVDHRDGDLRPRRAVQVRVPVGQRRVQGAHRSDIEWGDIQWGAIGWHGAGRVIADACSQLPVFLPSALPVPGAASEAAERGLEYSSLPRPAMTAKIPANPATASRPPAITSVLVAPVHPAPAGW